jgi:hypothetical protein
MSSVAFGMILWAWEPPSQWRTELTMFLCICLVFCCAGTFNAYWHEFNGRKKKAAQVSRAVVKQSLREFSIFSGIKERMVACVRCGEAVRLVEEPGMPQDLGSFQLMKTFTCPACGKTQIIPNEFWLQK